MTANQIDAALSASIERVGVMLLAAGEDQWFERKSARVSARKLASALVAFANAEGGTIVVGLSAGAIEGVENLPNYAQNDLRQAHITQVQPPIRATYEEVVCLRADGSEARLLVIHVGPSEHVHETNDASCYLRVGDESIRLTFEQRRELVFDKSTSQFEAESVSGSSSSDLDASLLENYRTAISATQGLEPLLRNRGLSDKDGLISVAGYLLFGEHPQDRFPNAHVRIVKFLSDERGTGSRLNVDSGHDYRIEGPIPRAIMEAQKVLEGLVPKRRYLGEEGVFQDHPLIPRDAWLEGLVNAVIHRSYSLAGDHIRVEVYPNRIEFHSPGKFPGIVNLSEPTKIDRFARNPRIARVCADLRIGQELGEGIKRIFDEMRRVGLTDPVYEQTQSSVNLVLRAVNRIAPSVLRRLPKKSQDVLDALRQLGGEASTGDLAEELNWAKPTVKTRLDALQQERLVVWVGKSSRDPRAFWRIA